MRGNSDYEIIKFADWVTIKEVHLPEGTKMGIKTYCVGCAQLQ